MTTKDPKAPPQKESEHANNPTTDRPGSTRNPNEPAKTPGHPSDVARETERIDQTDGLKDRDSLPPNKTDQR